MCFSIGIEHTPEVTKLYDEESEPSETLLCYHFALAAFDVVTSQHHSSLS